MQMQLVVKVVPSDIAWHWQNLNTADCLERLPSSSYGALKKSYHGNKAVSCSDCKCCLYICYCILQMYRSKGTIIKLIRRDTHKRSI